MGLISSSTPTKYFRALDRAKEIDPEAFAATAHPTDYNKIARQRDAISKAQTEILTTGEEAPQ